MTDVRTTKSDNIPLSDKKVDIVGKIGDSTQQKLYKQLKSYNDGAASTYRGALVVLNSENNPDRFRQAAHSLRMMSGLIVKDVSSEDKWDNRAVTTIVLDWLNDFIDSNPPTSEEVISFKKKLENFTLNHIKKMILMIKNDDPKGGPPEHVLKEITQRWNEAHKYFNIVSKTGKASEVDFLKNLSELETILFNITSSYYDNRDAIKRLLNKKPSEELARKLSKMIMSHRSFEYLFENASAEWLIPLKDAGFFTLPDQKLREWPPSKYLSRIIKDKPREIVDIVTLMSKTSNPVIIDDIVNIALNIDSKFTLEIVRIIFEEKWVRKGFFGDNYWSGRNASKLIDYLVNCGEIKAAQNLLKNLLQFEGKDDGSSFRSAKTFIKDYDYQELLEKHINGLITKGPVETLGIIARFLNATYFKFYKKIDGKNIYRKNKDYSYLDYKDIDDTMGYSRDAREMLLKSLVKKLEEIGASNPDKLIESMAKINYPVYMFRMIKFRIYNKFPEMFENEIKESLLEPANYEDMEEVGEIFSELIHENFKLLNGAERKKVFEIINKYPKYIAELKDGSKKEPFFERWKYQIIYLIQDYLDDENKKWFDAIKGKYGEPSFEKGAATSWIGPTSDISVEGFNNMDPDLIIKELEEWVPPEGSMVDSVEGRGRNLSESIKHNPNKYFSIASTFIEKKLRFTYIHNLFWGLELAHREKHNMNWDAIIDAGIKLVRLKEEEINQFQNKIGEDFEYDYDGAIRSLLSLIDQGLGQKEIEVPINRRKDIWEIIKKGTQSSDPDLKHEKEYGGDNMDPFTMSINTTRGEAMHALIKYASWVVQQSKKKRGLPDEVIDKLIYHLDYKNDPTETIHCIYGRYLPFLSYQEPVWFEKNIGLIFPDEADKFLIWKAAFGTYLKGSMYVDLFPKLLAQYNKAVEYVSVTKEKKDGRDNFMEKLAAHITLAVTYNTKGAIDIAKKMFNSDNERLKQHAIFFAGANILKPELKNIKDEKYPNPENLKWIWQELVDKLSPEAAKGFGYWFVNSPYDKKFTIERLVKTLKVTEGQLDAERKINQELNKYVDDFPEEVFECIELIIKGDVHGWHLPYRIDEYANLLRKIKNKADAELSNRISQLADFLGKKGFDGKFEEFK